MLRAIVWLADRVLWPMAAAGSVTQLARRLDGVRRAEVWRDCVRTGATPLEAHVWRSLHGSAHPLPARASALLTSRLGDGQAHQLLADKHATATLLSGVGLRFPGLVRLLERGEPINVPDVARWRGALFVKPRRGHGGRGGFALAGDGADWRIDGRRVSTSHLLQRIARLMLHDDILIQERLRASPDLADLASDDRPPVLRLVTTRLPDAEPVLHSALLTIGVPDRDPGHFLEGAVHVPINIATGRMTRGVALARPGARLDRLSWNAAPLTDRQLPDFDQAVEAALMAMRALPPLPVVHWDLIPTADGPVLLEGNTSGNWIIASLPERDGVAAYSLARVLAQWPAGASASPGPADRR